MPSNKIDAEMPVESSFFYCNWIFANTTINTLHLVWPEAVQTPSVEVEVRWKWITLRIWTQKGCQLSLLTLVIYQKTQLGDIYYNTGMLWGWGLLSLLSSFRGAYLLGNSREVRPWRAAELHFVLLFAAESVHFSSMLSHLRLKLCSPPNTVIVGCLMLLT